MANPPITIGPFANVPAPGSPIRSDWAQQITTHVVGMVSAGTYVPVLTACAVGTGGAAFNEARYAFVGGPAVGDIGILKVWGHFTFGTAGVTFPTAGPQVSLPPGFTVAGLGYAGGAPVGRHVINDADAADYYGTVRHWTNTTVLIQLENVAGTYNAVTNTFNATAPMTWAAGDDVLYSYEVLAARV